MADDATTPPEETPEDRWPVVKSYILGGEPAGVSNAAGTTEDDARVFTNLGAIVPPYDPRRLSEMFERSTALRPNVDVYKTNIEAFGHRLVPTIDLDASDIDEKIQEALILRKIADGDRTPDAPSEEVEAEKMTLPARMRLERLRAEQFFQNAAGDISLIELRERLRLDLEVTGNAFFEVLRDLEGRPAQLVYLPAVSIRLMRANRGFTEVEEMRKVSALDLRRYRVKRRLRQYVQVLYGQFVAYFKELDDPRVTSSRSGYVYKTLEALQLAEPEVPPATEVVHLKIHSPFSAYGTPRWVGATLEVLGSRSAAEVNVTYFDNKAVPPLAILVSGGKLASGVADKLKTYIRDNIKGKDNFHRILVLEMEPAQGALTGANGSRARIQIEKLMDVQQADALFQDYDANNAEKIGNQFRLPKILRGDMKDFNRATAEAALEYAEQQVFQPERNKIDHVVNRRLLPLLGVRFFDFVSNGVQMKDPVQHSEMVREHVKAGIFTPNEGRDLSGEDFGKTFEKREESWADQPLEITIAAAKAAAAPAAPPATKSLEEEAQRLIALRTAFVDAEKRVGLTALEEARKDDAQVILVPAEVWHKFFEKDDNAANDAG